MLKNDRALQPWFGFAFKVYSSAEQAMKVPKAMTVSSGETKQKLDIVLYANSRRRKLELQKWKGIVVPLSLHFS